MQIAGMIPHHPSGTADYHVVPLHGMWAVKWEQYDDDYFGEWGTQRDAISYAVEQAKAGAVAVVIHGSDGKVREVWNYARGNRVGQ